MAEIEKRIAELGLTLPQPMNTASLPFELARVVGDRVVLSGHVPINTDGSIARPLGKVGGAVSPDEGYQAARVVGLGLIATLADVLGDLDRVEQWVKLFGMVNVAPEFNAIPPVINGCSDLMVEVFGDAGKHARFALGAGSLPLDVAVEIDAVFEIE